MCVLPVFSSLLVVWCLQVCVFNVVDQAQEFLREHNHKQPDEDSISKQATQSLWHQWQQRVHVDSSNNSASAPPATRVGSEGSQRVMHDTILSHISQKLNASPVLMGGMSDTLAMVAHGDLADNGLEGLDELSSSWDHAGADLFGEEDDLFTLVANMKVIVPSQQQVLQSAMDRGSRLVLSKEMATTGTEDSVQLSQDRPASSLPLISEGSSEDSLFSVMDSQPRVVLPLPSPQQPLLGELSIVHRPATISQASSNSLTREGLAGLPVPLHMKKGAVLSKPGTARGSGPGSIRFQPHSPHQQQAHARDYGASSSSASRVSGTQECLRMIEKEGHIQEDEGSSGSGEYSDDQSITDDSVEDSDEDDVSQVDGLVEATPPGNRSAHVQGNTNKHKKSYQRGRELGVEDNTYPSHGGVETLKFYDVSSSSESDGGGHSGDSDGDHDDDDDDDDDDDTEEEQEEASIMLRQLLRKASDTSLGIRGQMLLGHLLLFITEGAAAAMPSGSSKLLIHHLYRSGLVPVWLYRMMTQNPGSLEAACMALFSQERAMAQASIHNQVLTNFWACLHTSPMNDDAKTRASTDGKQHTSSKSIEATPAEESSAVTSRYKLDFQEVARLGKGGFGVVAAAINRLDGCKYAIKKIRLDSKARSPHSYARIIREVSTLSTLQHPNVVRYFQAWCESANGADLLLESSSGSEEEGQISGSYDWRNHRGSHTPKMSDSQSSVGREPSSGSFSVPPRLTKGEELLSMYCQHHLTSGNYWDKLIKLGEGDESREDTLPVPTDRQPDYEAEESRRSRRDRSTQLLYIQMEFCPRTLQQMLLEAPLAEAEAWQMLRGILSGLSHIHNQGVIHRDLKPANIFFSSTGEVKLGDFGLAKFHSQDTVPVSSSTNANLLAGLSRPTDQKEHIAVPSVADVIVAHHSMPQGSENTGVCGTSFYISPEIAHGWASYDAKVDLFSLGVIVFELWHPFSTAMERVVILNSLRESGNLPEQWQRKNPKVAHLIRWLMSANPADRPTAREVLRSDVLPPLVEDEQLKDLLRSLPDNSDAYEQVVDAIFGTVANRQATRAVAAAVGVGNGGFMVPGLPGGETVVIEGGGPGLTLYEQAGSPASIQVHLQDTVLKCLRRVFDNHCAVPMTSQPIGVAHPNHLNSNAVRMLLPSGSLLTMRYELRQPFAAWLTQQAASTSSSPASPSVAPGPVLNGSSWDAMRRYEVALVARKGKGRGLPATFLQADLDIVTPSSLAPIERLLSEAEAVACITQVLDGMPELGQYEIRINHRQLLELLLGSLGFPKDAVAPALQLLSTAASTTCQLRYLNPQVYNHGWTTHSEWLVVTYYLFMIQGSSASSSNSHYPLLANEGQLTGRARLWPAIRAGLEGLGLSQESINRCKQGILSLPGEAFSSIDRLRSHMREVLKSSNSLQASAFAALDELQIFARHLSSWGCGPVLVDPLLVRPETDYYKSCMFQVHLLGPSGDTAMVAVGGRYDALLRSMWTPAAYASGMPPGAVGATVNVERLTRLLGQSLSSRQQQQQAEGGLSSQQVLIRQSQAEVLILSRGGDGLLDARMQVLALCWAGGIKAELVPRSSPSLSEQYEYAHARNIRWMVILDESRWETSRAVKIKGLDRKTEVIVALPDVPKYLHTVLTGMPVPPRLHHILSLGSPGGVSGSGRESTPMGGSGGPLQTSQPGAGGTLEDIAGTGSTAPQYHHHHYHHKGQRHASEGEKEGGKQAAMFQTTGRSSSRVGAAPGGDQNEALIAPSQEVRGARGARGRDVREEVRGKGGLSHVEKRMLTR
ncbi:hypothetical protein CEUSTIGMA_g9582.t1 [Chlamydomonas eustigma]|uniref:Protein kinase domain-containing protein n=1 Tax=Chlamydomonas eustigma TaxID=1157962 RepID=A0A250XGE6_9CHLO|nr:hypothetical protein CEUSTIGMA_g9582.t1 [Chlamydomonas eustigma]|eukprot:GAX82154.1 hypothetical protein CEUSTIGMA_g9582.t1 [Chlamydomonas eustigma]